MNKTRIALVCAVVAANALLLGCKGGLGTSDTELVSSAQAYLKKQDLGAAEIELKSAIQKNPQNADARLWLGVVLLESGNASTAEIELRKALELGASVDDVHPHLARVMSVQGKSRELIQQFAGTRYGKPASAAQVKTQLAAAHLLLGERDQGRQLVAAALQDDPGLTEAKLIQARLVAGDGDVPKAQVLVQEILSADARHLGALMLKGELLRLGPEKDKVGATAAYAEAVAAHPRSVAAHAALVGLAREQGDAAAARAAYEAMRKAVPSDPETQLYEAQFAFIDKDYAKARELTTQLLRIAPNELRVVYLAGMAELRLNSLTQAEAHLRKVSTVVPQAVEPRQLLAGIYNRTGQPSRSLEILKPLLESPLVDSNSLTLAAVASMQSGELAKAESLFNRAAQVNPGATTARTALALGQVARGDTVEGFKELEAVAAADPGVRSNMALIAARMRSNDLPGALRAIEELQKKEPQGAMAHALRGSIQLQQKDTAAASASFEQALKNDPLFFPATAGLAAIELAAGRPEGAQKRFETLLQADANNVRALLGLAELKARTGGKKDEVTAAIDRAIRAAPSEVAPRLLMINHLLGQKDTAGAVSAAQNAAAAVPDSPEILEALGTVQLSAGQNQQAISSFAKLASLRPDRPELELRLADAHLANGDPEEARRSLNKALQVRANFFPAQRGLALLAMREKKPDEALRIAQAAQRDHPKLPAAHTLQADIEMGRNQPGAAVDPLRKALELSNSSEVAIRLHSTLEMANRSGDADRLAASWTRDKPRDVAFRYYLGDRALARKDLATAESQYSAVLQIQPDNALAMNNLAWLMAQDKRPGALEMAEKANKLMPDQPALMDTLAYVLALEKQTQRAVELQKRAMAKAPDNPSLRLTLAKIYLQAGEKANARTELETLSQLGDKFANQAEVSRLKGEL